VLDEQGVEFAWVLPSLGLGIEEMLKDDLEGLCAVARSYNEWLDDDWGYDRDGRIQTAPLLPLGDADAAELELRRVIEHGARLAVMRPAPVASIVGPRSLGDAAHDRIWALAAEAGVVVAFHAADDGYPYAGDWGENARYTGIKQTARRQGAHHRLAGVEGTRHRYDHLPPARLAVQPTAILGRTVSDRL